MIGDRNVNEFQVRAIGKDMRSSVLDEKIVKGRKLANDAIKQLKEKYGDSLDSVVVWNESTQKPAKGWNDGYR